MDIGIISNRYAKALLKFSTSRAEGSQVYAEMQSLAAAFLSFAQLRTALASPIAEDAKKVALLSAACIAPDGANLSESTKRFLQLLAENKRIDLAQFVANAFVSRFEEKHHIVKGKLIVPAKVNDALLKRLEEIIQGKTERSLEISVQEDTSIRGGFILEYGGYRLDASLSHQMNALRRKLHSLPGQA